MDNELEFNNDWKRRKKEQDWWNILYKKSMDEKELDEERNRLTNIQSNNLSQSDILYATNDELKNKIATDNNLKNKFLNIENNTNILKEKVQNKIISNTNNGISNNINKNNSKNINTTENEYVKPTNTGEITSLYGMRIHPTKKIQKLHDGIDISMPVGTPVNSATNGIVTKVGWVNGYGKYIKIEYKNSKGEKIETFYAHLSEFKTKDGKEIKIGQRIKQGEQIGLSGNTGIGTGPHLHFGAAKNNKSINPIEIIGNVYKKRAY